VEHLQQRYDINPGETTEDDRLSLLTARCVGACGLAPAIVIDGDVLGKLDSESLISKLEELG
jgi:bidirectional [NiFe] hydrogenase diaphorase subunit